MKFIIFHRADVNIVWAAYKHLWSVPKILFVSCYSLRILFELTATVIQFTSFDILPEMLMQWDVIDLEFAPLFLLWFTGMFSNYACKPSRQVGVHLLDDWEDFPSGNFHQIFRKGFGLGSWKSGSFPPLVDPHSHDRISLLSGENLEVPCKGFDM